MFFCLTASARTCDLPAMMVRSSSVKRTFLTLAASIAVALSCSGLTALALALAGCSSDGPVTGPAPDASCSERPVECDIGDANGSIDSPPAVDRGADDVVAPEPVRIIRGDPTIASWLTLNIEGHGLTALEGRMVSVRIGLPDRP